jgi:hypothetical protein
MSAALGHLHGRCLFVHPRLRRRQQVLPALLHRRPRHRLRMSATCGDGVVDRKAAT